VKSNDELVGLCVRDLLAAFRLPSALSPLARLPAIRFARVVRQFDDTVGTQGLAAAGQLILRHFTGSVRVSEAEPLPKMGPLIVASNHPGMTDAMAIWTALPRSDIRIIAANRDLLQLLPNIRRYLILIEPNSTAAIRAAKCHLRNGGCLLTFPAGHIEPDSAVRPGADTSFGDWSSSVVTLARQVPEAKIVPVFVRGVISAKATRAPFLRYLRQQKDRDWAAATLQILLPTYRRVDVKVDFGNCVLANLSAILTEMQRLSRGA
jgi:hypothetical protein